MSTHGYISSVKNEEERIPLIMGTLGYVPQKKQ